MADDLAKQAKLKVAGEAIAVKQLHDLAENEVKDVQRLKAKHLGKEFAGCDSAAGDPVGDFIICDDYRHVSNAPAAATSGRLVTALLCLLSVAAGGGVGGLLLHLLTRSSNSAVETITRKIEPQEFEVQWRVIDGKMQQDIRQVEPGK